jgi:hypothetical protein
MTDRHAHRPPGTGAPGGDPFSMEPFVFATAQYASGDWDSAPMLPANVIDSVARYTALPVRPQGVSVPLSSEAVFAYPLLFLTGHLPVRFTMREAEVLRAYLLRGGLLFVDDHNHDVDGAFHQTVREEIRRVAGPLVPLPNTHELYRCFFVFENGPPTTSHEMNGWGDNLVHEQLDAVLRNGRISVLYSSKDYSSEWSFHPDNKRFLSVDNTKFAVNLVVYALTR